MRIASRRNPVCSFHQPVKLCRKATLQRITIFVFILFFLVINFHTIQNDNNYKYYNFIYPNSKYLPELLRIATDTTIRSYLDQKTTVESFLIRNEIKTCFKIFLSSFLVKISIFLVFAVSYKQSVISYK